METDTNEDVNKVCKEIQEYVASVKRRIGKASAGLPYFSEGAVLDKHEVDTVFTELDSVHQLTEQLRQ